MNAEALLSNACVTKQSVKNNHAIQFPVKEESGVICPALFFLQSAIISL